MKILSLLFVAFMASNSSWAQLKVTARCPAFTVDFLDGNVSGLYPITDIIKIKTTLPCFTELVEKDSAGKCIGVFYKDKDIYFYTDRRYIEVGERFNGKMSPALIGTVRGTLFRTLGHPKLKDINWEAYQTEYGTLILYYNKANKVNRIQFSSKGTDNIQLCN